jgi:DNA-binding sugar fermentation-stimulating protein
MIIEIQKVKVINRPSKKVKSPYMADIEINNKIELAHSPSLGLCGLIMGGADVMVSQSGNDTRKSKYTIELVENLNPKKKKVLIGANSLFANKIFTNYLDKFAEFENYIIEKSEIKIHNSRLDFLLIDKLKNKCYVEVKNVPLIEY